jgi:hypothetical protein
MSRAERTQAWVRYVDVGCASMCVDVTVMVEKPKSEDLKNSKPRILTPTTLGALLRTPLRKFERFLGWSFWFLGLLHSARVHCSTRISGTPVCSVVFSLLEGIDDHHTPYLLRIY